MICRHIVVLYIILWLQLYIIFIVFAIILLFTCNFNIFFVILNHVLVYFTPTCIPFCFPRLFLNLFLAFFSINKISKRIPFCLTLPYHHLFYTGGLFVWWIGLLNTLAFSKFTLGFILPMLNSYVLEFGQPQISKWVTFRLCSKWYLVLIEDLFLTCFFCFFKFIQAWF